MIDMNKIEKIVLYPKQDTIDKSDDTELLSLHLRGQFDIVNKASESQRIIAGYASVIEIDKENHLIPKDTLVKGIETLLKNSEYANLMLVHQNIQVGKIIDKFNDLTTHVDDKGLFIVAEIRSDLNVSNILWDEILAGTINGFSIGGEVVLSHDECNKDGCIKVIDELNIFEVSVCTKPVNSKSGFIVVSKSDIDDCIECIFDNKELDIMAKKKIDEVVVKADEEEVVEEPTEEEVEEEQPEEEVEPTEEPEVEEKAEEDLATMTLQEAVNKLEELYRDITAIKGTLEEMRNAQPMDDEEEEEEEEEEDEMMKSDDNPEPEIESPSEEIAKDDEEPEEEPEEEITNAYPTKEDFDEFKKSIEELINGKFSDDKKIEDLETSIKSKDDQIAALTKRIEVIEKSEQPQTEDIENKDVVVQEYKPKLMKDVLRPGTLYRELD